MVLALTSQTAAVAFGWLVNCPILVQIEECDLDRVISLDGIKGAMLLSREIDALCVEELPSRATGSGCDICLQQRILGTDHQLARSTTAVGC